MNQPAMKTCKTQPYSPGKDVDLLRFSTAGSVDDGKSTLIGRLLYDSQSICEDTLAGIQAASRKLNRAQPDLSFLTDGLKAEREQGITIDVAYRHFSTPRRRFIIADTPGHDQYTRNMVTGASTAGLIILLVDARNGITTQTKRHAFLAALMGIPQIVLAVNKMDLAGYHEAVFRRICEEFSGHAAGLDLGECAFIPISALYGENVIRISENMTWYQGPTLLGHLEAVPVSRKETSANFRLPVQFVNRPSDRFRGVCGTVSSGVVRPGEEVAVLPSGRRTRVKSICGFEGDRPRAFASQAVTITLADEIDISRGDILVHPANPPSVCQQAGAVVVWMDDAPLQPGQAYLFKHTCSLLRGRIAQIDCRVDPGTLQRQPASTLTLNDIGHVEMEFFRPLACDTYRQNRQTGSFIVIDPASNRTVACGMISRCGPPPTAAAEAPRRVRRENSLVSPDQRRKTFGQRAVTVWLTGLSGAGKTTIARTLEKHLLDRGHPAFMLDGDNLRHGLSRDLGFSPEDRSENIRRAAEAACLLNDAGLIVLAAFISPAAADRRQARDIIGEDRFLEIHIACPLEVCQQRDVKGLYKKASAGEIRQFTGVSARYEPPAAPDLVLRTDLAPLDQAIQLLMRLLHEAQVLDRPCVSEYVSRHSPPE